MSITPCLGAVTVGSGAVRDHVIAPIVDLSNVNLPELTSKRGKIRTDTIGSTGMTRWDALGNHCKILSKLVIAPRPYVRHEHDFYSLTSCRTSRDRLECCYGARDC